MHILQRSTFYVFVYFCIIFVCLCFCVRTVLSTMRILCKRVGRWFRRMTLTHSENLGWLIVAVIGNINMLLTIPGGQTLAIAKVCHSSYHPQMLFCEKETTALSNQTYRGIKLVNFVKSAQTLFRTDWGTKSLIQVLSFNLRRAENLGKIVGISSW